VAIVDNRAEVRDFLASRRAKITPEQAGLTLYGRNRRVPGLRREEVARLAGLSVDYYARLEKGSLGGASDGVLDAIAGALQLDDVERAHLFDLARAAHTPPGDQPLGMAIDTRRPPAGTIIHSDHGVQFGASAGGRGLRALVVDLAATRCSGRPCGEDGPLVVGRQLRLPGQAMSSSRTVTLTCASSCFARASRR
jgi:transcriptional regulator with XRE-family HTH domain